MLAILVEKHLRPNLTSKDISTCIVADLAKRVFQFKVNNNTGSPLIGRKKWSRRKPPYEKFALWEELKNSISTLKLEAEDHNFNSNSAVYCINKKLEVIFLKNHWYILLLNWIFFSKTTLSRGLTVLWEESQFFINRTIEKSGLWEGTLWGDPL